MLFDYSKRELKKLEKQADKILNLESYYSDFTDEQLKGMKVKFQNDYTNNVITEEELMIQSFAVCREATWRVLNKKQYKVQIMGGIVLHQGRVAEMKTGEGKTLTELCPAYLNALMGNCVHIVTVNEYLSGRDCEEMRPLFEFLGISVGLVLDGTTDKKEQFSRDVVYSTNTEIGFSYLRDNTVRSINDKVMRGLDFIIIDEVDSVLIDEAQTPLIIATPTQAPSQIYNAIIPVIRNFVEDEDYLYDRKESTITYTKEGFTKLENMLGWNLLDEDNIDLFHYAYQSLRAEKTMHLGKDYVLDGDEVVLVDQSTGRLAEGRRFSDGLHQALEAKEGISLKAESETLASITYPNLFELYKKVSGMSGTVKTDEDEFREIYSLDVVVIPTNKPIQRVDEEDTIVTKKSLKLKLIGKDIKDHNSKGQPILVCAQSINESKEISDYLNSIGVQNRLLNAYSKDEEADIISRAGDIGSVTVSTNMAGRGTDIKLPDEVLTLGGLRVIGTERSTTRRIDNQLIGRAGRRGEPGSSKFYVSFEDDLYTKYHNPKLEKVMEKYSDKEVELTGKSILNTVDQLQRIYYGMQYEGRKDNVKYAQVSNIQRATIYKSRDEALKLAESPLPEKSIEFLENNMKEVFKEELLLKGLVESEDDESEVYLTKEFYNELGYTFNIPITYFEFYKDTYNTYHQLGEVVEELIGIVKDDVMRTFNEVSSQDISRIIMGALVSAIDVSWLRQLKELELGRLRVRNQSYNQKDPAMMYKMDAVESFYHMESALRKTFNSYIFENAIPNIKISKLGVLSEEKEIEVTVEEITNSSEFEMQQIRF